MRGADQLKAQDGGSKVQNRRVLTSIRRKMVRGAEKNKRQR